MENVTIYEGPLRGWLRAQMLSAADVDDILQEAFLKVYQASRERPISSPKAYLFATARNLVRGRARALRNAQPVSLDNDDVVALFADGDDTPRQVAAAEELEMLTQAIQHLPRKCRRILTLMKIYGMSQKEVAAELSISPKTVENQCAIGMRKIARYFERQAKSERQT